jgi:hypothetical protein
MIMSLAKCSVVIKKESSIRSDSESSYLSCVYV